MSLFSPGALWFLLLLPLLILLYILKQKHESREISSLYLWQQVIEDAEASTPFQKLRNNILFFLQLVVLLLAIFAMANPYVKWGNRNFENVVIVLDTTGSMSSTYGKSTRFQEAKNKVENLVESLPPESKITLISSGKNNKVELNGATNKKDVLNKLNAIEITNSTGDINSSYSLIKAITEQYKNYKVIYFTDNTVNLKDLNGQIVPLNEYRENVGLEYISYTMDKGSLKVMIRVTNHSANQNNQEVLLYGDEKLVDIKKIELKKGETKTIYFDKVPKEVNYLRGALSQKDGLKEDDNIYSVVNQKDRLRVIVYSEKNIFLDRILGTLKDIDVYNSTKDTELKEKYNLYIYDGIVPKIMPSSGNILFINPKESNEFFKVLGDLGGGNGEFKKSALTKFLENSEFTIAKLKKVENPYWTSPLITVGNNTAAFYGQSKGRKIVSLNFDLHNTDLTLMVEFPIMINNILSYLLNRNTNFEGQYICGDSIEIAPMSDSDKLWLNYDGKKVGDLSIKYPLKPFDKAYKPGIYEVKQKVGNNEFSKFIAVNFPKEESDLRVSENQQIKQLKDVTVKGGINLKNHLLIAALLLLLMEWLVYVKQNGR